MQTHAYSTSTAHYLYILIYTIIKAVDVVWYVVKIKIILTRVTIQHKALAYAVCCNLSACVRVLRLPCRRVYLWLSRATAMEINNVILLYLYSVTWEKKEDNFCKHDQEPIVKEASLVLADCAQHAVAPAM